MTQNRLILLREGTVILKVLGQVRTTEQAKWFIQDFSRLNLLQLNRFHSLLNIKTMTAIKTEKPIFTKLDEVNLQMAETKLSSKGYILFKAATLHKYKTLMKKKIQSIFNEQQL